MQFNVLGEANVLVWGLIPDHNEVSDGGILFFKSETDDTVKLSVSTVTNFAQLQLRCGDGWDTYRGIATDDETAKLSEIYFRGC